MWSGLLGDSIATVADARRAAATREPRGKQRRKLRGSGSVRTGQPGARRRAGEPSQTVRQLECVARLDAVEGSPDVADVKDLVRTASLGPEIISAATTAKLVELAPGCAGAVGDPRCGSGGSRPARVLRVRPERDGS